jgi:hypothetical protein
MTNASIRFVNGEVDITLTPQTEEHKQLLLLAFKERVVKSVSPGEKGEMVLHLEKKGAE